MFTEPDTDVDDEPSTYHPVVTDGYDTSRVIERYETPDQRTAVINLDDANAEGAEWRFTLKHQFLPLPVAALLWSAAELAHDAPDTWPIGAPVACSVYFVAAVTWWVTWARNHPESRVQRRRWATTLIATGGAWLAWAATIGPGHVLSALLVTGGAALAIPYWNRSSPWQPHQDAEPEPEPEFEPELEPVADIDVPEPPTLEPVDERTSNQLHWEVTVGGPHGALPGAHLLTEGCTITEEYEEYVAQLVGGQQTTGAAIAAAARIASAYGAGLDVVSVRPYPSGDQDKALVRFAGRGHNNPLAKTWWYPGPEMAIDLTGGNIRVLIGYRADGAPVWWTVYLAGWGAKGGAVFGDTGSGKSELLRSLITSLSYTRLVLPIVACPQGGASFPMWIRHGHWPAASADKILIQARALEKAHVVRGQINELRGVEFHTPTAEAPVIIFVIDEIHKMMTHPDATEFYAILDRLEREGRKTCIRAIVADQDPSTYKTLGGLMSLRRSLTGGGGQCVTLRLSSKVDAMLPGMKLNPVDLPEKFPDGSLTSGLGVVLGEWEAFRVARLRDAEGLAANAPTLTIETAVANRMGEDYLHRHEVALEDKASTALAVAEFDPDLARELVGENPGLADAVEALKKKRAEQAATASVQPPVAVPTPNAIQPARVPGPPVFRVPTRAELAPPPKTCRDLVRELLTQGVTRFGDIQKRALRPDGSPYSETSIRNALTELGAEDNGYGQWKVA